MKTLNERINIVAPNQVKSYGGTYEADKGELKHVRLQILRELISLMMDDQAESGEYLGIMSYEIETLSKEVYSMVAPFVEKGINVFENKDWHHPDRLACYTKYLEPTYQGFWGEGYHDKEAATQELTLNSFTPDNGYSGEDLVAITNLRVGQAYVIPDPAMHSIVRLW